MLETSCADSFDSRKKIFPEDDHYPDLGGGGGIGGCEITVT